MLIVLCGMQNNARGRGAEHTARRDQAEAVALRLYCVVCQTRLHMPARTWRTPLGLDPRRESRAAGSKATPRRRHKAEAQRGGRTSSSSLRLRASLTRTRPGTPLMPWLHRNLLSFVSRRTSAVPIIFVANAFTSFTARGARFLKPMLCSTLRMWMVYSRVTTSSLRLMVLPPFAMAPLESQERGSGARSAYRRGAGTRAPLQDPPAPALCAAPQRSNSADAPLGLHPERVSRARRRRRALAQLPQARRARGRSRELGLRRKGQSSMRAYLFDVAGRAHPTAVFFLFSGSQV